LPLNLAYYHSPYEKAVAPITSGDRKKVIDLFWRNIPYRKVYKTDVNEATEFITQQPLNLGSKILPAGTYSLILS